MRLRRRTAAIALAVTLGGGAILVDAAVSQAGGRTSGTTMSTSKGTTSSRTATANRANAIRTRAAAVTG